MLEIVGLVALLTVLVLLLVINRVATSALVLTGLSRDVARFQSRSALSGTGFTTHEAEDVVSHPARRNIVMVLMLVHSAGLVTIVISLILAFVGQEEGMGRINILFGLVGGVLVIGLLARSGFVEHHLNRVIGWALARWTSVETRDFVRLLDLRGDYNIAEIEVGEGDWLQDRTLESCDLIGEGVTVLGIRRKDGSYLGAPQMNAKISEGDTILFYGRSETLQEISTRQAGPTGDEAHRRAIREQDEFIARQDAGERTARET